VTDERPHPVTGESFGSPVTAGSGWPGDPATAATPVARTPADVGSLAASAATLDELEARVSVCRACPRLVRWREDVAAARRRSFDDQPYWGRPVPGWGDDEPWLLIVGLAPAAHGGNRTGRIFTGDRSGDWLFAALHRAGLAAQATSVHAGDGQRMLGCRVHAAVRCAPPDNKPTPAERAACAPWLDHETQLVLPSVRVLLALGGIAWDATLSMARRLGWAGPAGEPLRRVPFGHGTQLGLTPPGGRPVTLLGCYHVSQQNTFTGRLTEPMLDEVFAAAKGIAGLR
jgi:uracil-DNA glycosylase family 4